MQGRKTAIHIEMDDQTRATLVGWLRRRLWAWPSGRGPCCCWQMDTALPPPPDRWSYANGMSASGRSALWPMASMGCTTKNVRAASPFFPPAVALYVVKLACERPDTAGRSLAQWDCAELARQLVRDGVVEAISPQTVQRMLGHASAAMTLDVYSGLFDDDLDAVADRLGEAAAAAVPPVCPADDSGRSP